MSDQKFENVCVIGLGYVGLPTAAVLASRGVQVLGVDIDENTVGLINKGKVHIVEPDLDILVNGAVLTGKLRAGTRPESSDAFIIAVPTPFTDERKPDLSYVESAVLSLSDVIKKGDLVIIESTCPVGTTDRVSAWLAEARPDLTFPHTAGNEADVNISHSPERVLPGKVLIELVRNDRVIGGISKRCAERTAALYNIAVEGKCLLTNARTAELVKLTENAYRDVNIAFANELSLVSDDLDIDIWEAIELANHHPRVNILSPGPGVGGHCIAVDPWFIVDSAPNSTPLIKAARSVNDGKPQRIIAQVLAAAKKAEISVIACLGLAYKANIDDLRESPAVDITKALAESGMTIKVVEPHIKTLPKSLEENKNIELTDLTSAVEQSDVILLLTDHDAFRSITLGELAAKKVFDTRGVWR
jgi:UDP-N-acetyl-D-mannosaminuronic acid dehydrogenase